MKKLWDRIFKGLKESDQFSFCEAVQAGSRSRWHIRKLTKAGRKLGGGIDTNALCGYPKAGWGWDLEVPISEHHLECSACKECAEKFVEMSNAGS